MLTPAEIASRERTRQNSFVQFSFGSSRRLQYARLSLVFWCGLISLCPSYASVAIAPPSSSLPCSLNVFVSGFGLSGSDSRWVVPAISTKSFSPANPRDFRVIAFLGNLDDGIFWRIRMAVDAGFCIGKRTPSSVFGISDRLKVQRVAACGIPAQVVYCESGGDGPHEKLIRPPVNRNISSKLIDSGVTFFQAPSPVPAPPNSVYGDIIEYELFIYQPACHRVFFGSGVIQSAANIKIFITC